jgi:hypothetical protein
VTTTRISHNPFAQPARTESGGLVRGWCRFWFSPVDPVGLHGVRWLAGLLFLAWLLSFAGRVDAFFGLDGWLDRQGMTEMTNLMRQQPNQPNPFGWSVLYLAGNNATLLHVIYWASVVVLALFTLGVATRCTAPLAWVVVASFTAQPLISYDADALLVLLAFYLMVGYLFYGLQNRDQSPWRLLFGWTTPWLLGRGRIADPATPPSVGANVALRLLQINLAVVLVASGLHKLQIGEWWAGWAYWYPFVPPFTTTLEQVRAEASNGALILGVLSLAAYATLAWQIGFPFFAWQPRCRWLLLGGAVVGWLGLIFAYALPLFGPAILIGCLGFLTPAEWHRGLSWLWRVPGLGRLATHEVPAGNDAEEAAPDGQRYSSESLAIMGRR